MHRRPLEPAAASQNYVDGECYYFALALSCITDLPMLEVGNVTGGHFYGGHAVIELPDGSVADASGVWSRSDMLKEWEAEIFKPLLESELLAALSDDEDDDSETHKISAHVLERVAVAELTMLADTGFLDGLGVQWHRIAPRARSNGPRL